MPIKKMQSRFHILDAFLLFIPISAAFYYLHVNSILTFIATAVAIVGISHVIIEATGTIAQRTSTTVSALINTTFGNMIEFILAIFSLRAGLLDMVKSSMVGSIIINVLLLIGVSMFFGGLKYKEQEFNKESAGVSSTMLIIVVAGLALPSVYNLLKNEPAPAMSFAVSVVLGIVYLLTLLYTLVTHKHLFVVKHTVPLPSTYSWSIRRSVIMLLIAVGFGAFMSFILVETITPLMNDMGLTERFVGLVFIAILTNIPEHITAVSYARSNNMTMSLEIGMSSALQISLFVVPALVLLSPAIIGGTLDLVFSPFSLIALVMTAMIANYISTDGVCHWLEGAQLIAVYLLVAIAFFFI
jgi:Ca2+:H+ antiporter